MKTFKYEDVVYFSVEQKDEHYLRRCCGCVFEVKYICRLKTPCSLSLNEIYKKLSDIRMSKIKSIYEDKI